MQITNIIFKSIVFAVLYLIFASIKKGKYLDNALNKIVRKRTNLIIFGTLGLLIAPMVVTISLLLIIFGLYIIALPILIIYFAILFISIILSIFVVGAIITTYIKSKWLQNKSSLVMSLISFGIFTLLQIITIIPYISTIAQILYVMFTFGAFIVFVGNKSV